MVRIDLTSKVFAPAAIRRLRYSIAFASMINGLILMPLWYRDPSIIEIVFPFPGSGFWYSLTHFLYDLPGWGQLVFLFIYLLAALGLLIYRMRVPSIVLLIFIGHALNAQAYPLLNMSQYLLLALSTYLLFMDERADEKRGAMGVVGRGLANTFYIICWSQVLAAYIFPFYYKVQGEMWLNGTALGTILAIPEFSRTSILEFARPDHWLFMIMTWIVLLYQAAFPILIWSKAVKPYLLVAGVLFNLGIGIAMGLMDIAVVMIAAYAILLDEATIMKLKDWLPRFSKRREAVPSSCE